MNGGHGSCVTTHSYRRRGHGKEEAPRGVRGSDGRVASDGFGELRPSEAQALEHAARAKGVRQLASVALAHSADARRRLRPRALARDPLLALLGGPYDNTQRLLRGKWTQKRSAVRTKAKSFETFRDQGFLSEALTNPRHPRSHRRQDNGHDGRSSRVQRADAGHDSPFRRYSPGCKRGEPWMGSNQPSPVRFMRITRAPEPDW